MVQISYEEKADFLKNLFFSSGLDPDIKSVNSTEFVICYLEHDI